ncbi:MAG: homoserine dehydrogenase [Actinomycetota bacterium]
MSTRDPVRVGLLGCGHVGSAVARMLADHADEVGARAGGRVEVTRVAVRNLSKERDVELPAEVFTHDPHEVVSDPNVDVVVEVIGGIEPARSLILEAFERGKPVITANKELLSTLGRELFEAAEKHRVDLLYEASVGGGIPLIRPLKQGLAGERIVKLMGIVNGTTNYVLTRMEEDALSLHDAVAEAQALGYAERDPTADIEGFDAAAKAAILAMIAFDTQVVAGDVYREGITGLSADDIVYAKQLGYVVKLLAIAETQEGDVSVRVHPAMVPADHPLATVRHSFNAVVIEGQRVGSVMLYGRGAGGDPTATSVVGDLVEAVHNLREGTASHAPVTYQPRRIKPIDEISSQYYILLEVDDRPGVLAAIATAFSEHDVSIKSVWQEGREDQARLVMITHRSSEHSLQACVHALRGLDPVRSVMSVLRVEASEP